MTTISAGAWTLDQKIDRKAIEAMKAWMVDQSVAWSIGREPTPLSDAEFSAIVAQHDGETGWLFFARSVEDDAPHAYVSIVVSPINGAARLDILVGDRRAPHRKLLNHVTRALMPWMFETIGIRKIIVSVRADNRVTAAWVGRRMTLEGTLRGEMVMPDGTGVDLLRFGLLRDEWREAVRRSEASLRSEWDRPMRTTIPIRPSSDQRPF